MTAETANAIDAMRRGALDDWPLAEAGGPQARMSLIEPRTIVNLRGNAAAHGFRALVRSVVGCELPLVPNRWSGGADGAVLWLGPDEWLVFARDTDPALIERGFESVMNAAVVSVVDLSHGYTGLELAGTAICDVLAKGCPLDLHSRVFGDGHCARTLLAGTRVLLCGRDDPGGGLRIECWVHNSFARYSAQWFADAMAEYREATPAGQ